MSKQHSGKEPVPEHMRLKPLEMTDEEKAEHEAFVARLRGAANRSRRSRTRQHVNTSGLRSSKQRG